MIDIILAAYNGRQYLKEQLDSILEQDYRDFRLIIRDDASNDGTLELLNMYSVLYPDKIQLFEGSEASGSAKNNFFILMKATTAPYVMFADQDDVWEKDKVSKAVSHMKKMEKKLGADKPLLCHGDLKVVNEKLEPICDSMGKMQKLNFHRRRFRDYLVQNNVTGCTMIANRTLINMCEEMPEEAIMHDWWLALIASGFGKVGYIGDAGIKYRQHSLNTEGAKNLRSPFYLLRKLFNRREVKEALRLTYAQAEKFSEIFGDRLEIDRQERLQMYLSLQNKMKLSKLITVFEYKFSKSGLARELGYLLYL